MPDITIKLNTAYTTRWNYDITSDLPFFTVGEDYVVKSDEYSISFRRPDLDHTGKTQSCYPGKGERVRLIYQGELPEGTFEPDEESDEDQLIFYFDG